MYCLSFLKSFITSFLLSQFYFVFTFAGVVWFWFIPFTCRFPVFPAIHLRYQRGTFFSSLVYSCLLYKVSRDAWFISGLSILFNWSYFYFCTCTSYCLASLICPEGFSLQCRRQVWFWVGKIPLEMAVMVTHWHLLFKILVENSSGMQNGGVTRVKHEFSY